jgi:hypothetical protein
LYFIVKTTAAFGIGMVETVTSDPTILYRAYW